MSHIDCPRMPQWGRHHSGSEDGGDMVDPCWAAPRSASLGDALAAALAKAAGTPKSGDAVNTKKKVPK